MSSNSITPGGAPLLSIYGGKITTYRRLAEEALEQLAPYLHGTKAARRLDRQGGAARRRPGCLGAAGADAPNCCATIRSSAASHANRLAHAYGTRAAKLLGTAKSAADLGQSLRRDA